MGKLVYGNTYEVEFDDRVLAHLQLVIGLKLRRHEGFFFSWHDDRPSGEGRTSIWIDPSIPMVFKFNGGRPPKINREWLELLTMSSNSAQGLQLTEESNANGIAIEPGGAIG